MADLVTRIDTQLSSAEQDNQPAGSFTLAKLRSLTVSLSPPETIINYATSVNWNLNTDPVAQLTLTGNVTVTVSGGETGRTYRLAIIQAGVGSNTVALAGCVTLGTPIYRTAVGAVNLLSIDIVGLTPYAMVV